VSREPAACHLTTTGRRSGRPHRIEIWFARHGDTLYLLAGGGHGADWVRNLIEDPAVEVELAGRRHRARARVLVHDDDEDLAARAMLLDKYQHPGSHDLEGWGRRALAVALELAPEP
jgi:deazaflavin-dependent oxidoreductase (nitroreductase family)